VRFVCRALDGAAAAGCAALLVAFTVIILVDVVCRYWLHIPIIWAAELTVFLFQVMSFLGAGLALRRGMHFGLGMLVKRVWPAAATVAQIGVSGVVGFTSAALLVLSVQMTIHSWGAMYTTLPLSRALIYMAMAFSAFMMLVFSIEALMQPAPARDDRPAT
jgi:TRAP-type C4-dicarboxylate transport system permease small subunit